MSDTLSPAQRHRVMSHIHSRGTKPELKVRQWLWRHGYRYRLNVKSVPGKPDIVMRKYRTAIFVNGCFWHGHALQWDSDTSLVHSPCCKLPASNREFWENKIRRNQQRDQENYQVLLQNGWNVIVVWECQLKAKRIDATMWQVASQLKQNLIESSQTD